MKIEVKETRIIEITGIEENPQGLQGYFLRLRYRSEGDLASWEAAAVAPGGAASENIPLDPRVVANAATIAEFAAQVKSHVSS